MLRYDEFIDNVMATESSQWYTSTSSSPVGRESIALLIFMQQALLLGSADSASRWGTWCCCPVDLRGSVNNDDLSRRPAVAVMDHIPLNLQCRILPLARVTSAGSEGFGCLGIVNKKSLLPGSSRGLYFLSISRGTLPGFSDPIRRQPLETIKPRRPGYATVAKHDHGPIGKRKQVVINQRLPNRSQTKTHVPGCCAKASGQDGSSWGLFGALCIFLTSIMPLKIRHPKSQVVFLPDILRRYCNSPARVFKASGLEKT